MTCEWCRPIRTCLIYLLPLLVPLWLTACGTASQKPSGPVSKPATSTAAPATGSASATAAGQPAPNLPKAGSGRGAYYKDDGPGENPPAGLELTLDAEPKVEPYSSSGNKPYVVFGKTYTPMLDDRPFSQRGTGSWYGKKFHGQKTSSGELYDMYKMTAAHPTLPIPSYARITNISNGKQVIVKINDRGPFHTNRIVDLSYTAALKLDYLGKGSSELLLERLLPADIEKMAENKKNNKPDGVASFPVPVPPPVSVATPVAIVQAAPVVSPVLGAAKAVDSVGFEALIATKTEAANETHAVASEPVTAPMPAPVPAPVPAPIAAPVPDPAAASALPAVAPVAAANLPPVINAPNPTSGFYLQFGAFGLRSNAEATFTRLQSQLAQLPAFEIVQQGTLYRLFSGPFASRDEAADAVQLAMSVGVPRPLIVQR